MYLHQLMYLLSQVESTWELINAPRNYGGIKRIIFTFLVRRPYTPAYQPNRTIQTNNVNAKPESALTYIP